MNANIPWTQLGSQLSDNEVRKELSSQLVLLVEFLFYLLSKLM